MILAIHILAIATLWTTLFLYPLLTGFFPLLENINYAIYVHDPDLFKLTDNPAVIPDILLTMSMTGYPLVYIEVVQHIKLDRLQQPCEDGENYSFTACIKNSVSR